MAQHDYIISNQTFPNTRADINNLASAIATNNSGTSAPTTQYAGQFWIDTTSTTWTLYIHDGTDDIQFATIDTSANTVNFVDSALDVVTDTTPQLGGNLDLNSNDITGTGNINITGNATVSGDLTVDADTLYVDSTNNRVGINTSSPTNTLQVTGNIYASSSIRANGGNTASSPNFAVDGNAGMFKPAGNLVGFSTASKERMRIDSNGDISFYEDTGTTPKFFWDTSAERLGIGTSSPNQILEVLKTGGGSIRLSELSARYVEITGYAEGTANGSTMAFSTIESGTSTLTERMRIDSSGNVLVGKTVNDENTNGIRLSSVGLANFARNSGGVLTLNRNGTDGTVVDIRGQGTTEGNISVSGATVSYNGFTGTHWSRLSDNSKPTILKGTILESLD